MTSRRDEQNKTRYWNYDATSGLLDEVRFEDDIPTGVRSRETYTYDANRNQTTVTDRYGATNHYKFDSLNRPIEHRDPRSTPATTNPPTTTDNRFLTTTTYEGTTRRSLTVTPPSPLAPVTNTYTNGTTDPAHPSGIAPAGLLKSTSNQLGAATNYLYYLNGDLFRRTEPVGLVSEYTYDELGRERFRAESGPGISDGSGTGLYSGPQVYETKWDKNSRIVGTKEPMVPAHDGEPAHRYGTEQTYDPNGNPLVLTEQDFGSGTTPTNITTLTYAYDTLDREKSVTTVQGGVSTPRTTEYDDRGYVKAVVDEEGRRYEATRDPRGNIDKVILKGYQADPVNNSAPFDLTILDADHDWVDRRIADTDAEGRRIEFSLFDVGDRPGRVTLKAYEPLPTTLGGPGGSPVDVVLEDNVYDDAGHLLSMIEGNGKKRSTWQYYNSGLKQNEEIATQNGASWTTNRRTEWTYNGAGNPTVEVKKALSVPGVSDRETRTRYTTAGFVDQLTVEMGATDIVTTHTSLDARGNPRVTQDPGGFVTDTRYDPLGRAIAILSPTVTNETNGGTPTSSRPIRKIAYTARGDVSRQIDANGNVAVTTYDELQRKKTVTHPSYTPPGGSAITPTETFTYDKVGNLTESVDRRGKTSTFFFDKLNRSYRQLVPWKTDTQTRRAESRTWFDKVGNVTKTQGPFAEGQQATEGSVVDYTYDKRNQVRTSTEQLPGQTPSQALSSFDYDLLGNKIFEKRPENPSDPTTGGWVSATFDATGAQLSATNQFGWTTTNTISPFGETTATVDPTGRCEQTVFDNAGRPVTHWNRGTSCSTPDGSSLKSTIAYDLRSNPTLRTSPEGRKQNTEWDNAGRMTAVTDAFGSTTTNPATTRLYYDAAGNNTRIRSANKAADPAANVLTDTVIKYQSWNLPETRREPKVGTQLDWQREFTVSYDAAGLVTKEASPGTSQATPVTITRTFDDAGNPATETDSTNGGVRSFAYDAAGRLTSASHPTAPITIAYNARNQPTQVGGGNSTTSYAYDIAGRLTQRTDSVGVSNITWDKADRVKTQSDPQTAGTVEFGYDQANRPTAELRWRGAVGTVPDTSIPVTFRTFDPFGRLATDLTSKTLDDAVDSFGPFYEHGKQYSYDKDSNVTQEIVGGDAAGIPDAGIHTYAYNDRSQLTSWTAPGQPAVTYAYDRNGNRTQAGTTTYTYDPQDRLACATVSGSCANQTGAITNYTWADRGTLTSRSAGGPDTARTYTYNGYGQELTSGSIIYTYDALGRIAARTDATPVTRQHRYNGVGLDAIDDGSYKTAQRFDGSPLSVKTGAASRWAITDGHGDLTVLQRADTGIGTSTYGYDPFGVRTVPSGHWPATIGFQSDYTDPTSGEIWMGARHYRPSTGTFTSRDSYNGKLDTPVSLNRYTYAHGNPLNMVDPDGHAPNPAGYGSRGDYDRAVEQEIANHRWNNGVWYHQIAMNNGATETDFSSWWTAYQEKVLDPAYNTIRQAAAAAWAAAHPDGGDPREPSPRPAPVDTPFDKALGDAGFTPIEYSKGDRDGGKNGVGFKLVAVRGNLSTAKHIIIYVPGTGAGPGNSYDLGRAEQIAIAAGPDTAVVLYGYDAPDGLPVAHDNDYAKRAGAGLKNLIERVNSAHAGANVSVIGYSYGSLVAGNALACNETNRCGRGVDNLVIVGSPGMGFQNRRDLRRVPKVWVFEDENDPVADTGWFTTDPSSWTGTNGQNTSYVRFRPLRSSRTGSHSNYFDRRRDGGALECIVSRAKGMNESCA